MSTQVFYARPEESGRNYVTTGAVTGGRIVAYSGDKTVAHAAAGSLLAAGWVPYDVASGGLAPVYREGVVPCEASGTITAGQRVVAAANGTVAAAAAVTTPTAGDVTTTRATVGFAEAGATNGNPVPIVLNIQ